MDLISVRANGARLVDFKTGAQDEKHAEQLRLYALLWSEDREVNPDAVPASELVIAYPDDDIRIPAPRATDLQEIRHHVVESIQKAEAALSVDPPEPRPGDHCRRCPVRGLCDAYWAQGAVGTPGEEQWIDVHGIVLGANGVKSYRLQNQGAQNEILVRTPVPSYQLPIGSEVRLLNVRRQVDPDNPEALIVGITSLSEVLELAD